MHGFGGLHPRVCTRNEPGIENIMRIAFVAHNALGALRGGAGRHIGGIERQTSLLARWLAGRGHEVSVLVWDEGQGAEIDVGGLRVIALAPRERGLPGLRFFYPRWTSLLRGMRRADAELYFHNGAEYITGQVGLWCRAHGRPWVFSTASDTDCQSDSPRLTTLRERWLYRIGLRLADRIVVQTEAQRLALEANFARAGVVLPMGAIDPYEGAQHAPSADNWRAFRVCWIGRISREKRLEWLLDIAEQNAELAFDVVGATDTDPEYAAALETRARRLGNLRWHGRVPPEDMPRVYAGAAALCSTSIWEGFPNTFLEAWAQGVPVVSTVDPDGVIKRVGLGYQSTSREDLVTALLRLKRDQALWAETSARCRGYFLETFDGEAAFPRFERLFEALLAARR